MENEPPLNLVEELKAMEHLFNNSNTATPNVLYIRVRAREQLAKRQLLKPGFKRIAFLDAGKIAGYKSLSAMFQNVKNASLAQTPESWPATMRFLSYSLQSYCTRQSHNNSDISKMAARRSRT